MGWKRRIATAWIVLLLAAGVGHAGSRINEVGALGVYPAVVGLNGMLPGTSANIETFLCLTNAGPWEITAHLSFINGQEEICAEVNDDWSCQPNPEYCHECDFRFDLTPNDTECLVVTQAGGLTTMESEDGHGPNDERISNTCGQPFGMVVVSMEDEDGAAISDNFLLGSEVVVDYTNGVAFSIPMVPFLGKMHNRPGPTFSFDDMEYGKLPRIVAADFLAPNYDRSIFAGLALFTLGFDRQHPPLTDCSVTMFDAEENPISDSFQFGCWTFADVCEINPEFCYPYLGATQPDDGDTHGWFMLSCRVDQDPQLANGYDADGGVHGALVQVAGQGTKIRGPRGKAGKKTDFFNGNVAWSRLLYQSVTSGDPVTLHLEEYANNQGGLF